MSSSKKHRSKSFRRLSFREHLSTSLEKRKRHFSPITSRIAIRLEKLRRGHRNLWGDDDDDQQSRPSKMIILSNSEEERPSPKRKSRKKTSTKNPRCLICSILSQLSSYNCCSDHLSLLKNHSNPQWLPEQVMIVPVTDEIVQRYLDPHQIHQLRSQTTTNSVKSIVDPSSQDFDHFQTKKISNKSTMTSNLSDSPRKDLLPLASTIVVESTRSNSVTIPPDVSISPVSTTMISHSESITLLDETPSETILNKPPHDPWIPISDEIDAALEQALDHIDSSVNTPLEFTPATVRRTETEIMAARLPKIPLKPGRFRQGKPILDRSTTNAANEYRPLAATQSSSNARSPSPPSNTTDENIFTQDIQTNELPTTTRTIENITPSRISFRLNPDGTRVSISRPPLPTHSQSPLIHSLRRNSTDVTPISKQV